MNIDDQVKMLKQKGRTNQEIRDFLALGWSEDEISRAVKSLPNDGNANIEPRLEYGASYSVKKGLSLPL